MLSAAVSNDTAARLLLCCQDTAYAWVISERQVEFSQAASGKLVCKQPYMRVQIQISTDHFRLLKTSLCLHGTSLI